jgi:superfamily II DNA or RNA helicase
MDKQPYTPTINLTGFNLPASYLRRRLGNAYQKFLEDLTVRTKQTIGPDKIARAYSEYFVDGYKFISLPRVVCQDMKKNGFIKNINNNMPIGRQINLIAEGKLNDCQQIIVDVLMKNIYNNDNIIKGISNCTFVMGAGKGKTFVAAGIIGQIGKTTLYVAPTKHLRVQAVDDLRKMYPAAKIYQVKGKEVTSVLAGETKKLFDFRTADICVCVINTAIKMPTEFFNNFGFTIFDEVHMYCAPEFSKIFWKSQTNCVMGMTATPSRTDGFDLIYKKCVGDIVTADSLLEAAEYVADDVKFTGKVTAIYYYGAPEHTVTTTRLVGGRDIIYVQGIIRQLIEDETRNNMAVDEIMKLYTDITRNIFVFSESRDHLILLADLLSNKIHEPAGILRGGVSRDQITLAVGSRIILTTYSYSGTGVSIKKMNALVFLTPRRSNMVQILGRILRLGGDHTIQREIIDIVDARTPLRGQFTCVRNDKATRQKAYEFYGFPVTKTYFHAVDYGLDEEDTNEDYPILYDDDD